MDLFKALPKGAQAEIQRRTIASTSVRFNNNQFEGTSQSRNTSMTLRLIKDGKMSLSTSSKPGSEEEMLENSNGFRGSYRKTAWHALLGGQLIRGDDFLWLGEGRSSWTTDVDCEDLKKEVLQQFDWAKDIVGFEPGAYPVIFAPSQVGFLMAPFLACLNGQGVRARDLPAQGEDGAAACRPEGDHRRRRDAPARDVECPL
jgi:predicted Zn-dependent protease